MAQDFMQGWLSGHLQKHEAEKVRATLKRMGLYDVPHEWEPLRWELLDWFVKYTKHDFTVLTEQRCSDIDEEVQIVQLLETFNLTPWIPNREEMKELQRSVLKIVSDLVETQGTRIGPIPVEFVIWRGRIKQEDLPEAQKAKGVAMIGGLPSLIGHPPAEGIGFQVPPVGMDALLHCLAQLLSKYPGAVRRCRCCETLFTRVKVGSRLGQDVSCSRKCQVQSYEQAKYWKEKEAAERKKKEAEGRRKRMELKKRKATHKKKGKGDATKRRTR